MTTTVNAQWRLHAAQLADTLTSAGKLTDPAWAAAVRDVPRHEFVPTFYTQDSTGAWTEHDASVPGELDAVYANKALITALRQDVTPVRVLSSSSQPGLMTRMLEALAVHEGHRVLEIGTGTGYNAALMSHRCGSDAVFSVDVEPELVGLARRRLATAGYTPTLVVGDGARGLPDHAPFDRIIATCAVPSIPWRWVDQLQADGAILADLKIAQGAGSLVRLTRVSSDRLEGQFDRTYAAFMGMRPHAGEPDRSVTWAERGTEVTHRGTTTVDPQTPWNSMVVWFLAALDLGRDVSIGFAGPDTSSPPTAVSLSTPDGSWAHVDLAAAAAGHQVVEGGRRRLWRMVEQADEVWREIGEPGWERFRLTVTPTAHTVWLDDSAAAWSFPTASSLPGAA